MADEILRDGEEHATEADVIANINAGNVALDNNMTYILGKIIRPYTNARRALEQPPYMLTIPMGVVGAEDSIKFKSGYTVGITYESGDITDLNAWKSVQYWIASPYAEDNIYTTAAGTPCNWCGSVSGRWVVEVPNIPAMQTDEMSACFYMYGDGAGESTVWDYNNLWFGMWGSHATSPDGTATWTQGYGEQNDFYNISNGMKFNTATCYQSFIDALAGNEYGPIVYPGENTDDYGGGGDGSFNDIDDIVQGGHAPTINPLTLGFVKVYNPSESDCRQIAAWLWSDDFDQNIKKNFVSPFENIISFGYMPLHGKLGTMQQENMIVGNCQANGGDYGPAIPLNKVMTHAVQIDCGSLSRDKITKFWNGFLDYNSTFTLWLPYVGYRSIRADDIFNKNDKYGGVRVSCWIDILTGLIVWEVHSTANNGNKVIASFSGNCLSQMPISGANFMSMYNQQLSASVAGNQNIINKAGNALSGVLNAARGNFAGAANNFLSILGNNEQDKLIDRQKETAAPEYGRAGNMSANAGSYGYRTPYFIKSRPLCSIPNLHTHLNGIPSDRSITLGDLKSGYTEMQTIELNISKATNEELEAIRDALTKGTFI